MFSWFYEFEASVEKGISSRIEAEFLNLAESFNSNIREWFQVPEPAELYQSFHKFFPNTDRTINQNGITIEQDCWKIESYGEKKERKAPLSTRSIRHIIARAGELAGLPFQVHPHQLRHGCD